MKSHRAPIAWRGKVYRSQILGLVALLVLALTSITVSGCSRLDTASEAQALSLPETSSIETTATGADDAGVGDPNAAMRAQHERVMAEQSAGRHSPAATGGAATGIEAAGAETTTSTTQTTSLEEDLVSSVGTDGQTSLRGVWSGTAEQLASFLMRECPSPRFTVSPSVLAEYYVQYCAEAGLRADLLWAQMIHETGYGMYGGDVSADQNNFAGIGATGGGQEGASFPTAEAGVLAHVAHMVAYVYPSSPVTWADANTDPRLRLRRPARRRVGPCRSQRTLGRSRDFVWAGHRRRRPGDQRRLDHRLSQQHLRHPRLQPRHVAIMLYLRHGWRIHARAVTSLPGGE